MRTSDSLPLKLTLAFFLSVLSLTQPCFAQSEGDTVSLPYTIEKEIKGIETEITLLQIQGDGRGAFADAIYRFKDPLTGKWVEFIVKDARFDSEGFIGEFELILEEHTEHSEARFTKDILERKAGRIYKWKCNCKCLPTDLVL